MGRVGLDLVWKSGLDCRKYQNDQSNIIEICNYENCWQSSSKSVRARRQLKFCIKYQWACSILVALRLKAHLLDLSQKTIIAPKLGAPRSAVRENAIMAAIWAYRCPAKADWQLLFFKVGKWNKTKWKGTERRKWWTERSRERRASWNLKWDGIVSMINVFEAVSWSDANKGLLWLLNKFQSSILSIYIDVDEN